MKQASQHHLKNICGWQSALKKRYNTKYCWLTINQYYKMKGKLIRQDRLWDKPSNAFMFWSLTNDKWNKYPTKYWLCDTNIVEWKALYEKASRHLNKWRKVFVNVLRPNDLIVRKRTTKQYVTMKRSMHNNSKNTL